VTNALHDPWPALPYEPWKDTLAFLQLELQVLGKLRVACSPHEPEWAHITLFVGARGLTTGPVPVALAGGPGLVEAEADLLAHEVVLRTSSGRTRAVPLAAPSVAAFHEAFLGGLRELGVDAELSTMPQEIADPVPFPEDTRARVYDGDAVTRFHRVLASILPVFDAYRGAFNGKVSRTQFFWGSMDLAVTRFSGDPCSPPPGADLLLRETYDYEQCSAGFWAGDARFPAPAFYAYGYPKPDGIEHATVGPAGAAWNDGLGELVLPYDDVRSTAAPAAAIREFLDSSYAAVAHLSGWDGSLCRD
jgi:hypothetical protein